MTGWSRIHKTAFSTFSFSKPQATSKKPSRGRRRRRNRRQRGTLHCSPATGKTTSTSNILSSTFAADIRHLSPATGTPTFAGNIRSSTFAARIHHLSPATGGPSFTSHIPIHVVVEPLPGDSLVLEIGVVVVVRVVGGIELLVVTGVAGHTELPNLISSTFTVEKPHSTQFIHTWVEYRLGTTQSVTSSARSRFTGEKPHSTQFIHNWVEYRLGTNAVVGEPFPGDSLILEIGVVVVV